MDDYAHYQVELHGLMKKLDAALLAKDFQKAKLYAAHMKLLLTMLAHAASATSTDVCAPSVKKPPTASGSN